jgi:septum formation protein
MLVLASNSPRRKQLLGLGGWSFTVRACEVDESVQPGELPDAYVRRLAESKARCALELLSAAERAQAVVIAADTTVVDPHGDGRFEGGFEILGKPANPAEAESMLRSLRGRTHQVVSGIAVLRAADGASRSEAVTTDVPMRAYS